MRKSDVYSLFLYKFFIKIYGISQYPDTKEYVMVIEYAEGGNLSDWMRKNESWD